MPWFNRRAAGGVGGTEVADRLRSLDSATHNDDGTGPSLFPRAMLKREPLFDSLIGNLYYPGDGIAKHVDLLDRFDDGIISLSFLSHTVMIFERLPIGEHIEESNAHPVEVWQT